MAGLKLELIDPQLHPKLTPHRVVPVRFARAVSGFSDDTAPDLDDHGFTLPSQFCSAKGPVVGLLGPKDGETVGPTVRIQLIRDRVEKDANLFATIDDTSVAQIDFPVGTALNANTIPASGANPERPPDCIFLKAAKNSDDETKLKIHFGSAGGPVMAEMAVRVYARIDIKVKAHVVSINGSAPNVTLDTAKGIFKDVNKIYAQAGVVFTVDDTLANEAVNNFALAGAVTLTNVADQRNQELQTVLNQNPDPDSLNAYFIGHYFDNTNNQTDGTVGIAFSQDDATGNPPTQTFVGCQAGITVHVSNNQVEVSHTTAHETGHALRLIHYANVNNPGRPDIWAHRCLMHPLIDISTTAPSSNIRADVGYGDLSPGDPLTGQLLMTKPRDTIRQSDEIHVLRDAAKAGSYKPVQRNNNQPGNP